MKLRYRLADHVAEPAATDLVLQHLLNPSIINLFSSGSYLEHESALRKGPSVSHLHKILPCRECYLHGICRPLGSFWQTFCAAS